MPRLAPSTFGAVAVSLVLGGCDDPLAPDLTIPEPPDVRAWVTGDAAEALDPKGHFTLPEPSAPGTMPIISRAFAGELALGFIRTWVANPNVVSFGRPIRSYMEDGHGDPVDWDRVELEDRVGYYAESPFEPPPGSVEPWQWRPMGPHYLVPLYVDGDQVATVSVAAYATDVGVRDDGYVETPKYSGGEFHGVGVPSEFAYPSPLWPEEVVRLVGQATGAKVVEIPELIQPGERWIPQGARWKLVLDREIVVEKDSTGERASTDEIYLGVWGDGREGTRRLKVWWYLPKEDQPTDVEYVYPEGPGRGWTETTVEVREGVPILFDTVTPVGS